MRFFMENCKVYTPIQKVIKVSIKMMDLKCKNWSEETKENQHPRVLWFSPQDGNNMGIVLCSQRTWFPWDGQDFSYWKAGRMQQVEEK